MKKHTSVIHSIATDFTIAAAKHIVSPSPASTTLPDNPCPLFPSSSALPTLSTPPQPVLLTHPGTGRNQWAILNSHFARPLVSGSDITPTSSALAREA